MSSSDFYTNFVNKINYAVEDEYNNCLTSANIIPYDNGHTYNLYNDSVKKCKNKLIVQTFGDTFDEQQAQGIIENIENKRLEYARENLSKAEKELSTAEEELKTVIIDTRKDELNRIISDSKTIISESKTKIEKLEKVIINLKLMINISKELRKGGKHKSRRNRKTNSKTKKNNKKTHNKTYRRH